MWTLDRIKKLIRDGVEENLHLDYKAAGALENIDSKKKEISKDVSAFANSDGGTIIYGIREFNEDEKRHLPQSIDPVDGSVITKEWLEQVINSRVSPRIRDVNITPVQVSDPELNNVIYVVDIPKSDTAHQASDKRYYKRFNFLSEMMEDWEIKDIINRQTKTNIDIYFESRPSKKTIEKRIRENQDFSFDLIIWAENKGTKITHYLSCFITGDSKAAKNIMYDEVGDNSFEIIFSNEVERKIQINNDEYVISVDRLPILPSTSRRIGTIKVDGNFIRDNNTITLQIATDDNNKYVDIKGKDLLEYIIK